MRRGTPGPVAAVVTDDLEALRAVRYAVRLARGSGRPLLLLVALADPDLAAHALHPRAARSRAERDADAVLGRVAPALQRQPVQVCSQLVRYLPRRTRSPGLGAVLRAARRADAAVLVAGPRWAGRRGARGPLLLDPVGGRPSSGQLAAVPDVDPGEDVARADVELGAARR